MNKRNGMNYTKLRHGISVVWNYSLAFIMIPCAFLIRLMRPFLLVRMEGINNEKFGHLIMNVELYLCEIETGINRPSVKFLDILYCARGETANEYVLNAWKRIILFAPSCIMRPLSIANRMIYSGAIHEIGSNANHDRDVLNLLERTMPHIGFNKYEVAGGENLLTLLGVSPRREFVCLCVRDDGYHGGHKDTARNADIASYSKAILELVDRGYYVLRMGKNNSRYSDVENQMFIDYSNSIYRNDFMDLFIGSRCRFMITTGTGCDGPAMLFRKPILYTNFFPVSYLITWGRDYLIIHKKILDNLTGELISLEHMVKDELASLDDIDGFSNLGLSLLDNTCDEILDCVVEMDGRISGVWLERAEDREMQYKYWQKFPRHLCDAGGRRLHGDIRCRIGTKFLRDNSSLFSAAKATQGLMPSAQVSVS